MTDPNPSKPGSADSPASPAPRSRTTEDWMFVGFSVGAATAIAFGVFTLVSDSLYFASLPEDERIMCGTGLGGWGMIIFGVPMIGLMGASVVWCWSKLCGARVSH